MPPPSCKTVAQIHHFNSDMRDLCILLRSRGRFVSLRESKEARFYAMHRSKCRRASCFLSCDKTARNAGRNTCVQPEANRGVNTTYGIALVSETHVIRHACGVRCEFGGGPNDRPILTGSRAYFTRFPKHRRTRQQ